MARDLIDRCMRVATSSLLIAAFAVHPDIGHAGEPVTPQPTNEPALHVAHEPQPEPAVPEPTDAPPGEPIPVPTEDEVPEPDPIEEPLVCRNSFDPRCGPLSWDPAPDPNQPLTIELTYTPARPKVGDEVTYRVTVTDPDAGNIILMLFYGDEEYVLIPPLMLRHQFGPWTTPAKERGVRRETFTHTYERAGTLRVGVWAASQFSDYNPYADETSWSTELHVEDAAPAPSPTPPDASPSPESSVEPTSTPAAGPSESPSPAASAS